MRWAKTGIILLFFILLHSPLHADDSKRTILIGLIPERNIFRQMDMYRPLAEYLSKKTGINVRFTILSKYGDVIDRFEQRSMDGAFFGDLTGVLAMELLGVKPLVRPVGPGGRWRSRGVIVVRKDSGIRSVSQLKQRVFAFVDRASVTGYLFAVYYLKEAGVGDIDSYFSEYYFTGSHDAALYAVLDGRADAASLREDILKDAVSKDPSIGDEIQVIARSDEMPVSTLCVRNDLPEEIRGLLRESLLNMSDDEKGKEVLMGMSISRFSPAKKEDFEVVYKLLRNVGLDARSYDYRTTGESVR
ncbi:MAG: phosphate/phosphite/phosphonate ABC transporter substrate-binding protein [Nitrospirae bacterium]|nr:MAG: phosphate/phosphite/phosphonate ABC transporter substrate-binding protein [Nitrospirota bacterium]